MEENIENSVYPELQSVDPPVLIISVFIFIILGICYSLPFKLLFDYNIIEFFLNNSKDKPKNVYLNMLGNKFILFILVFLSLTLSLLFFVYRLILRGSPEHYTNVYGCISVCFFTTVFLTFILLEIFPYLVTIFENTIGYLWICSRPISDINMFNQLFSQSIINTNALGESDEKYNISYKFLITLMSLYNIEDVLTDFRKQPNTDGNATSGGGGLNAMHKIFIKTDSMDDAKKNDITNKIANLCFIKYSTGHFVWIYFASLICTFTSIKAFSQYLV